MTPTWTIDAMWWISAFELPALGGLLTLLWRSRRELGNALSQLERELHSLDEDKRASIAAFKLEVAQSYASIAALKDVERRLTSHLVRIEHKLDGVQFQTLSPPRTLRDKGYD